MFSLLLMCICGCSSQPQMLGTMERVDEDGTMTVVEPLPKVEGQLSVEELIAKEGEIEELLEGQSYIEGAVATLFYQEGEPEKVCFLVTLEGDGLEEHMDEISALIVGELGSCDLENSSIMDIQGTIYHVK